MPIALAAPTVVGMTLVVGLTAHDLCPFGRPVADPPYENHTPAQYRVQPISVNSTASPVPFFGTVDSSDVAIRAAYARRNAQTRAAQTMFTTDGALLSDLFAKK